MGELSTESGDVALELTDDERRTLRDQYIDVHVKSQETYDESIRVLAAAALGVTVSIATALHKIDSAGIDALISFLGSLAATVASHQTAQKDMVERVKALDNGTYTGDGSSGWTTTTTWLNLFAGAALLLGAVCLAIYVAKAV
jgi:hypothetical protein